ncbi:asparagine synthase (glutamine-hydrolyzing) [Criblamydia sequanensis]|uniref:asparagine synthase (glutamine-hydrolyzing) n=1 Tax=Candidatus Criblamydia sequanensis CRIB-18 TaxID=1437425 RepID=A0A090CZC6_9BACT|nr:asparagine synthase (glutamine-hydrolyzing) [Criblamydia sequanensis]CDR34362.1 Asparagine synthetase [glutamine-hydrolyzing] [Criblamydia sequanensis CRIB-18]
MCGIAALISLNGIRNLKDIIEMSSKVAHRGPDDEGFVLFSNFEKAPEILGSSATPEDAFRLPLPYSPKEKINPSACFGRLALSHRRLSIFDLSSFGHQPMASPCSSLWIAYNGEIYNFPELKKELVKEGVSFRTGTDTEVLLQGYKRYGASFFHKLNGMFAFLLVDLNQKKLVAVRDRFGVKPLYYTLIEDKFLAFASEIKQFSSLSPWKAKLNHERAYDFLKSGIIDHEKETLFKNVFELRGGEFLTCDLNFPLETLQIKPWYTLSFTPFLGSFKEAVSQYKSLLQEAVSLRMRADVGFGSCLSGGLDSSSIVSLASLILEREQQKKPQATFSAISEDPLIDESPYISTLLESHQNIKSHLTLPTALDLKNNFDAIVWHQDLPFGSSSIYAQWKVFSLVKDKKIKVMLDGQGADELLCGYYEFYIPFLKELLKKKKFLFLGSELIGCKKNNPLIKPFRRFFQSLLPENFENSLRTRLKNSKEDLWLGKQPHQNNFFSSKDVADLSYKMVNAINLPMLLRFEDRNSMAHSIESRTPFLDYRLVEFTLGLPSHFKISLGETKSILREALKENLPPIIKNRKDKISFSTSEKNWFQKEAKHFFLNKIEESISVSNGLIKPEALIEAKKMAEGAQTYSPIAFRTLSFGSWVKQFKVVI